MRESQLVDRKESWRDEYPKRIYGHTWDDLPCPGVSIKDLDGRMLDQFRRRAAASAQPESRRPESQPEWARPESRSTAV